MAKKAKLCNFFIGVLIFVILMSLTHFVQREERKPTIIEKMASLGKFVSLETKGKALWNTLAKEQQEIKKKVKVREILEESRNGNRNRNGNSNGNGNIVEHMLPNQFVNWDDVNNTDLPTQIEVDLINVEEITEVFTTATSFSLEGIPKFKFVTYNLLNINDNLINFDRRGIPNMSEYENTTDMTVDVMFQITDLQVIGDKNIYTAEYVNFGKDNILPIEYLQGSHTSFTFGRINPDRREDLYAIMNWYNGGPPVERVINKNVIGTAGEAYKESSGVIIGQAGNETSDDFTDSIINVLSQNIMMTSVSSNQQAHQQAQNISSGEIEGNISFGINTNQQAQLQIDLESTINSMDNTDMISNIANEYSNRSGIDPPLIANTIKSHSINNETIKECLVKVQQTIEGGGKSSGDPLKDVANCAFPDGVKHSIMNEINSRKQNEIGPTEPTQDVGIGLEGRVGKRITKKKLEDCGMMSKLMEMKEMAEKIVASPELDMQKIQEANSEENKEKALIAGITSDNVYKQVEQLIAEVIKIQYSDLQMCFPEEAGIMEQHRGAINKQINKPLVWTILRKYSPQTQNLVNWGLKMLKEGLNNVQIRNHYISLITSLDARSEEESTIGVLTDTSKPDLARAFFGALPTPPQSAFGKNAKPLFAF